MTIGHDDSVNKPGWYLDEVRVEIDGGDSAVFPAHGWLAKDEGDGGTDVDLRRA